MISNKGSNDVSMILILLMILNLPFVLVDSIKLLLLKSYTPILKQVDQLFVIKNQINSGNLCARNSKFILKIAFKNNASCLIFGFDLLSIFLVELVSMSCGDVNENSVITCSQIKFIELLTHFNGFYRVEN